MDITYNKVDQTALPISQDRVSASEYNQIAASLMNIITSAGLTPDVNDNGQLLAALQKLVGTAVVETYTNGTSWYRVYSDGWCEQGGRIANVTETVTLLKEMADTNGTVTVTVNNTTAPSAASGNPCGGFISTTQIFVSASQGNLPAFWKVEGYIATGD